MYKKCNLIGNAKTVLKYENIKQNIFKKLIRKIAGTYMLYKTTVLYGHVVI